MIGWRKYKGKKDTLPLLSFLTNHVTQCMSTCTYPLLFNKEDYNIYEEIKTYKSFLDMFLSQLIHWLPLLHKCVPLFPGFFIQTSSCESSVNFTKICPVNMDASCLKTTLALSTPTIKDLSPLLWSSTHGSRS